MSDTVIQVEDLGKRYNLSHQASGSGLRHAIQDAMTAPFRFFRKEHSLESKAKVSSTEEFWALRDVSFDIKRGQAVGIIGRNGAGKSTLLKILSRITEPTVGRITIDGRVASLLEVGTGFHYELTGRENIFLNGAILGMSRAEIRRKLDEIISFAEVEKFLDTPVKHYSSGMYVRLAFAVAAHLEPEILIVDEVLSVGDVQFQKKCLGKMQDVSTKEGRTVLFVSHNLSAVQALCEKAIYLKSGRFVGMGGAPDLVQQYLGDVKEHYNDNKLNSIHLGPALVLNSFKFNPDPIISGQTASFVLDISSTANIYLMEIAILIYSGLGTRVAVLDLRPHGITNIRLNNSPLIITGTIKSLPLVEGHYDIGLYIKTETTCEDFMDLVSIQVLSPPYHDHVPYPAKNRGLIELAFSIDSISDK